MGFEFSRVVETRNGRAWVETYRDTDAATVYAHLCDDLIAKKLVKCAWIKSITRKSYPTGDQHITVDYGNGTRSKYTVPRSCFDAGLF